VATAVQTAEEPDLHAGRPHEQVSVFECEPERFHDLGDRRGILKILRSKLMHLHGVW
jgi:hypothetical protein